MLFLVLLPCCVGGQEKMKKNEVGVGVGMSAHDLNLFDRVADGIFNSDLLESTDAMKHSGFFLSYKRNLNNRLAVGGTVFYKPLYKNRHSENEHKDYWQRHVGLAVEGRCSYYTSGILEVYGLAGVGGYLTHEKFERTNNGTIEDSWTKAHSMRLAYQLSPFGLRVGRSWGIQWELGYGYKGCGTWELFLRF